MHDKNKDQRQDKYKQMTMEDLYRQKQTTVGPPLQPDRPSLNQEQWNVQNAKDIEMANELGADYQKHVDSQKAKALYRQQQDTEVAKELRERTKRRDEIHPASDSNRFEK